MPDVEMADEATGAQLATDGQKQGEEPFEELDLGSEDRTKGSESDSGSDWEVPEDTPAELKMRLKQQFYRINMLKTRVRERNVQARLAFHELKDAEHQRDDYRAALDSLQQDVPALREEIEGLTKDRDELQTRFDRVNSELLVKGTELQEAQQRLQVQSEILDSIQTSLTRRDQANKKHKGNDGPGSSKQAGQQTRQKQQAAAAAEPAKKYKVQRSRAIVAYCRSKEVSRCIVCYQKGHLAAECTSEPAKGNPPGFTE